jgi:hypothetical protein
MASISKQPNGRRTIQFVAADGKRRSIRLGKISQRNAEAVKVKVEQLAAASISGHVIDADTSRWVASLDAVMVEKLANAGLVPKRESATLGLFLENYFSMRTDVKSPTLTVWGHTRRNLLEFFGPDKSLRDINRGDAEKWRLSIVEQLSNTTVQKRCGFAKQFFSFAVKRELIASNPFVELKSGSVTNPNRYYFISRSEAEKVTEACPAHNGGCCSLCAAMVASGAHLRLCCCDGMILIGNPNGCLLPVQRPNIIPVENPGLRHYSRNSNRTSKNPSIWPNRERSSLSPDIEIPT